MSTTIEQTEIGGVDASLHVTGERGKEIAIPLQSPESLGKSLRLSYAELRGAMLEEQQGERDLAEAKRRVTEKQNSLIREKGAELGSNEAQRKAALEALCEDEIRIHQALDRQQLHLKHQRELAFLDVERDRALLRCFEAQVGINRWQERAER